MKTQHQVYDEIMEMWDLYKEKFPNVVLACDELPPGGYKDGVLSSGYGFFCFSMARSR